MKRMSLIVVGGFLLMLPATYTTPVAQADDEQVTGCLTRGGSLVKFAIGDHPARPCSRNQLQITLGSAGSEGAAVPFFVLLDGDQSEQTIATNGALEVFVRCELNRPDPRNPGRFLDVVSVVARSTVDNWTTTESQLLSANQEVVLLNSGDNIVAGGQSYVASGVNNGASAVAPDGSYIGVSADIIGLGANLYGHDCIAIGRAITIEGELE